MTKTTILIIGLLLFLAVIFTIVRLSVKDFRNEYGKNERVLWGARVYYWQAVIFVGGGITFFIMFFLTQMGVLSY